MDDNRHDGPSDGQIVVEPTAEQDREVTQQLEQAVSRVRRAREVLTHAREMDVSRNLFANEPEARAVGYTRSVVGARVLLVDDEDVILRLMARMIEGHGCTCVRASSGEEAIPLLEKEVFDLLIVDKNLPGLSGIEVAKLARWHQPGVPVLMITGYASEESALEAAAYGVVDYIQKPIDLEDFRRRMILALTKRSSGSPPPVTNSRVGSMNPGAPTGRAVRPLRRPSPAPRPPTTPADADDDTPIEVNVMLFDPDPASSKRLESLLKPACTRLSVFNDPMEAESFAHSVGYEVLVAVPSFLNVARTWQKRTLGQTPLGYIAIMNHGGIDKAIEAIQLGARGSLLLSFDDKQTVEDFRRIVKTLLEERQRK